MRRPACDLRALHGDTCYSDATRAFDLLVPDTVEIAASVNSCGQHVGVLRQRMVDVGWDLGDVRGLRREELVDDDY